jgi:hypothetical protein
VPSTIARSLPSTDLFWNTLVTHHHAPGLRARHCGGVLLGVAIGLQLVYACLYPL